MACKPLSCTNLRGDIKLEAEDPKELQVSLEGEGQFGNLIKDATTEDIYGNFGKGTRAYYLRLTQEKYLTEFVMPCLIHGMMKLWEVKPEKPIEYLVAYILKNEHNFPVIP